jgi:hypothetical protein
MLSSLGIIEETGRDEFGASVVAKNLSIPEIQAGVYHKYVLLNPNSLLSHSNEYMFQLRCVWSSLSSFPRISRLERLPERDRDT